MNFTGLDSMEDREMGLDGVEEMVTGWGGVGDDDDDDDPSWLEKFLHGLKSKNVSWGSGQLTWYNETLLYFTFGFKAKISVSSFGEI